MWLSLVECLVRDQEVAGSNPATPTKKILNNKSKIIHRFYIAILFIVGIFSVVFVGLNGMDYYLTPLTEKPYHPDYEMWKPTGFYGHGLGFLGTIMILIGVIIYSSRKRLKFFSNFGNINYWLEFHIFLCIVGPIFILYHTTFKLGGIVAVSFFSMTSVVLSGFIGRYFYVQIPKNIKGQELSLDELDEENKNLSQKLIEIHSLDAEVLSMIDKTFLDIKNKSNEFGYLLKEIFLKKFHRKKNFTSYSKTFVQSECFKK